MTIWALSILKISGKASWETRKALPTEQGEDQGYIRVSRVRICRSFHPNPWCIDPISTYLVTPWLSPGAASIPTWTSSQGLLGISFQLDFLMPYQRQVQSVLMPRVTVLASRRCKIGFLNGLSLPWKRVTNWEGSRIWGGVRRKVGDEWGSQSWACWIVKEYLETLKVTTRTSHRWSNRWSCLQNRQQKIKETTQTC